MQPSIQVFAPYEVTYGAISRLLSNVCSPENGGGEEVVTQDTLEENRQKVECIWLSAAENFRSSKKCKKRDMTNASNVRS